MANIYFRTNKKWKSTKVILLNADESVRDSKSLVRCDADGDMSFDFDTEKYDHLQFENEKDEKTSKIYPGKLSIGIEYKHNEKLDRELTYLFSKEVNKTGRVDNYILKDEKNLAHREDLSKKISVFVPSTYNDTTPHDILYFFDAQNLFGSAGDYTEDGDPYGGWQLDLILSEIHRQYEKNIIVVAIDNADKYRAQELFMNPAEFGELSPLATTSDEDNSKGYLEGLDDFIKETLHPFIKQKYCVSEDNMGVGGASMGGIAAFYCGLREYGVYKYVLSYSPAYALYEMSAYENWFSNKDFNENSDVLPKIHIYCGEGDPLERLLVGASKDMKSLLVKYGYPEVKIFETYDDQKPHNEESWRLILGESFDKLL